MSGWLLFFLWAWADRKILLILWGFCDAENRQVQSCKLSDDFVVLILAYLIIICDPNNNTLDYNNNSFILWGFCDAENRQVQSCKLSNDFIVLILAYLITVLTWIKIVISLEFWWCLLWTKVFTTNIASNDQKVGKNMEKLYMIK
jgi:hypothetical protein